MAVASATERELALEGFEEEGEKERGEGVPLRVPRLMSIDGVGP
jgi:hypothetical protein